MSVDIGFGDKLYPEKVLMDFPIILSDEAPEVYAYSVYSSIAEKFEAIVSLGFDNSRFKDFYDIYVNASKREFDGSTLLESFRETFENRNTDIGEIVAFEDEYATDPLRISRWNSFAKKKKISLNITLEDAIALIRKFLDPIITAMREGNSYEGHWDSNQREWML